MDINFQQFEQFLIKKDKKQPCMRPMSCIAERHNRHHSQLQAYNQHSLFKKPDNIGYTIRIPTYQKKKSHKKIRSNSYYDPLSIQQKIVQLKVGKTVGTKQLILRNKVQNIQNCYFKDKLNEKLRNWNKKQMEKMKIVYQKKKLRVVKGKANPYRQKLRSIEAPLQKNTSYLKHSCKDVNVIGTKLL